MAFVGLGDVRNTEHEAMLLADKLRAIRLHLGFTQDQMAEKLGLSETSRRSRVSEWENGRTEPNRFVLLKYTELVGVSVSQVIDDREVLTLEKRQGR